MAGVDAPRWVRAPTTRDPPELLRSAVEHVHPQAELAWDGDPYINSLASAQLGSRTSPADKAAVAQVVATRWDEVPGWPLDLEQRLTEVIDMIRHANEPN